MAQSLSGETPQQQQQAQHVFKNCFILQIYRTLIEKVKFIFQLLIK